MRKAWQDDLTNLAALLTIYTHTSLSDALNLPASIAGQVFETKAWKEHQRAEDGKLRLQSAQLSGINEQIRATGIVAKVIAKKP